MKSGKKAILGEQSRLQNKWLKELDITKKEALRIYDLLEWCDALSLLICKSELQPEERRIEISTGPDKKMYHLVQLNSDALSVDLWLFEVAGFSVHYDYRVIQQIQFSSSKEFRDAFLDAHTSEKRW
ncbi:DUF3891 family protein [Flavisolibacter sp. BT320]|nr:DUF3891 family protein [Flavisolibacter longurius]